MVSIDRTWTMMDKGPPPPGDSGGGGAYLLVVEYDSATIFPLPRTGVVEIGRHGENDLKLTHPSVSRHHATIKVADGAMRILDRGSHNGTRVNGEPVGDGRSLVSGDIAMIGDVVCVVQVSRPTPPARSVLGEPPLPRRLAEELERATRFARSLAVIAAIDPDLTLQAVAPALRFIDVPGQADDGHPLLLLPETDRDQARAVA
jgi:two-component system, NtrC family, response regulator AtoC